MSNNKNKVGRPKSNIEYVRTSIRLPKHLDTKANKAKGNKSKAKFIEDILITEIAKLAE
jgi:hypothetical protein